MALHIKGSDIIIEEISNENLLKYAMEHGMIDMLCIQEQIKMNKRKELIEKHPYKIWEGKDGKWRTYLSQNSNRKMIKRNTQREIEDIVIKHYTEMQEKEIPKTFDYVYWNWRSVQDKMISENSVSKYNTDYKRYFENECFSQKNVENITEEDIKVFITDKVKSLKLCKKASKTLFGYIKNTLKSAMINKIISDDPMKFLEAKQFYKYCTESEVSREKKLISNSDMKMLYQRFLDDYEKHPEYIPTYAVHFASLTGMRVGEISALSWDCITDTYIIINKSEKYNRKTKEYYIDKTKNGKDRIFPITEDIRILLEMVKRAELQNGYICEWVFANENGRVHAPVISSCAKNKCLQLGIDVKGIHSYRKTINSKLRCDGVSATVAASLLGHSVEVNEQYYTFDITGIEQKGQIISKISRIS